MGADAGRHDVRYKNIDVLRGIAALCVVWLHASEVFVTLPSVRSHGTSAYDIPKFLELGRVGVIAFFAISGFVVASTIKPPKIWGTRAFLIKRFFRLYPAFWFALALSYLAIWLPQAKVPSLGGLLANITMLPTIFGVEAAMGHFWTLEIEFAFYLLVVILFLVGKLHNAWLLVVLIAILSLNPSGVLIKKLTWMSAQGHWVQLPLCLAIMLWASLLRRAYDPNTSITQKLNAWRTVPIAIATAFVFGRALSIGGMLRAPDFVTYLSGLGTLWGLTLFCMFVLTGSSWPRWLVWIGTISYSIYLLHPVILYPLFFFVSSGFTFDSASLPAHVLTVIAGTIALASITYLLIEAPSNRLAARLTRDNSIQVTGTSRVS
ncbi:MAG TPA: acyltransferase [Burkholderiaceae bacterium]|nr:acyltransferase [Burkholderiaceae bacterium]